MSKPSSPAPRPSDLILERLTRLHPKIIDLSLDRVARLLGSLGSPQRRLPPVVHVAGTNGKGSVVAYLRAMLEAAGARVHVYTSPHLVRFNERIRVAGRLIDEAALAVLLEECEQVNGSAPITFFEITTAAAFLAFARQPADIVLLETGLGGRLDATNLVEQPLLTVLTPISFDHRQHLGDTLALIAGEKAGIMKAGVPAVVAPQPAEAAAVFAARAATLGLALYRHAEEWQVSAAADLRFRAGGREWLLPRPALLGRHQIVNAGTALAASQFLGDFGLDATAMARGLREVEWPARLQRLTQGPLPTHLPAGWELWLDGGHNGAAGEALADFVAGWRRDGSDLHLVFGMLDTKEPAEFLAPLAPFTASLRAVTIPGSHAALPAESAAAVARDVGMAASAAASVGAAVEAIAAGARPGRPARILICGSLYLAGSVLADNA